MMTSKEINRLKKYALQNKLIGAQCLNRYKNEELQKICNGIGGEQMPQQLNDAISKLNPSLVVCSVIHDVQWEESDGTVSSFYRTNDVFEQNGRIVARVNYPKWHQFCQRAYVCYKARLFRKVLDHFGHSHYVSCYKKRGKA